MCGDVKCIRGRCDMCIRGRCDMCIGDRQQCMGRRGKSTWGGARVHGEEGQEYMGRGKSAWGGGMCTDHGMHSSQ